MRLVKIQVTARTDGHQLASVMPVREDDAEKIMAELKAKGLTCFALPAGKSAPTSDSYTEGLGHGPWL